MRFFLAILVLVLVVVWGLVTFLASVGDQLAGVVAR